MADPAVVLLILLTADASDPATQAVLPAIRRPLGDRAIVLVQQAEAEPTDAEVLALARNVHATSAASFEWEDPAHSRVRLRVLGVEGAQRYEYELAFAADDAPPQRGRAVGLALAPLLVQTIVGAPASPPVGDSGVPPSKTVAEGEPPASPPSSSAVPEEASSAPSSVTSHTAPSPPVASMAPPSPRSPAQRDHDGSASDMGARNVRAPQPAGRFELDALAVGSVGIGGSALGAGPSLGLRWFALGPVSLRAVALARFGEVPSASAFASTAAAGGGVGWSFVRIGPPIHRVDVGVSADVLAMQHALLRRADGTARWRERWLTAFDATVDVSTRLSGVYEIVADVGVELASGPTAITVGGNTVDHIPVARVVAGLGVRAHL